MPRSGTGAGLPVARPNIPRPRVLYSRLDNAGRPRTASPAPQPPWKHVVVRVVGLGAICDLDPAGNHDPRENGFKVSEFALLDTGERVTLHAERGYGGRSSSGVIWAHETVETITRDVLTTVLPDDDDIDEEHPWEWLAELAHAQGIDVTADDLRQVPYEVVLTERVLHRLPSTPPSTRSA
jgi:hypothetical protein